MTAAIRRPRTAPSPGRRVPVLGIAALGVYVLGMGALGGIVYERWTFGERRVQIVRRLDAERRAWQARMMELELAGR